MSQCKISISDTQVTVKACFFKKRLPGIYLFQSMYDALKRKCITPSTFEGGDAVSNDRTRNVLANYTIPIGSDHGNSISYKIKTISTLCS